MKSILVVNIGTDVGGIEKCLINFLEFLSEKNCEIQLVTWKPAGALDVQIPQCVNKLPRLGPGSLKEIIKIKEIRIMIQRLTLYLRFRIAQRFGKAWKCLPIINKKYDVAISYCQNGYSPYYVIDNVQAEKKYLWYHHGSYEKSGKEKETDKYYFGKYDAIVSVSKANKIMLSDHFPELSEKIIVIHNLLNEAEICMKANEEVDIFNNKSGCKIVTVGRISPEKGQLIAIEVARVLKESGFAFFWVFVGDGPDRMLCEDKVKQYNLENNCIFIGAQLNPYAYMNQADIYVQTSTVEADPITIQEAKVLGKPIVASDIPAIHEAMEEVTNGRICEIHEEKFAEAIRKLYKVNRREAVDSSQKGRIRRDSDVKISNLLGI